jgi:hypothetical protein
MANLKLLEVFLNTKRILCASDYYIHIPKKIIYVTNSENMIPHLMGMQYIGRQDMFTGDRGAYMIKKGRLKYDSLEKLVGKYYRGKSKQDSILAMVNGKIDNLYRIEDMFSTYSELYLYDVAANPESELKTDYLLVNQLDDRVLQLGMVKADKKKVQEYHCNSFMVDYKENDDYDLHYRNLTQCYEISKIVREDKITKRSQVIYQSNTAKEREMAGIEKMLTSNEIAANSSLVKAIFRLNERFGEYHTIDMLLNSEQLLGKCRDKRDDELVNDFLMQWKKRTSGI